MSAPVSRDPLVVNTQNGTCWVRRAVTQDGRGLYALEGTPRCCPEYVLASFAELRELGFASMADALPVPIGASAEVPMTARAASVRLAQYGERTKTWSAATYDNGTEKALHEIAVTLDAEAKGLQARVDEVERKYTFDTAELRRQLESERVEGARLIRAEQRRAELEAVIATHRKDDRAEIERLRARADELEAERHSTNEALSDAAEALREQQNRIAELERPAGERHRREVRERYRWLAQHAREDGDFEGGTVVLQQLAEREALWAKEDELAREFAADPLAVKPWTPGPSAEASADKLTCLLAPSQALREGEVGEEPSLTVFRASHESIVMGRYTNLDSAREHCETVLRREIGEDVLLAWVPDHGGDDAPQELCFGEDIEGSGYVVTPLEIASKFDEEADE